MLRSAIASSLLAVYLLTVAGCGGVTTPPPPTGQLPLPKPPVGAGVPGGDKAKETQKPASAQ
jgi:hypothetical protein